MAVDAGARGMPIPVAITAALQSPWRRWLGIALFGIVYGLTAKLGLDQSTIASNVTLIWPPTGISLFVVLRWGPRWWPGIVIGDLIGNAGTGAPLASVLGIACGNVLETLVCAWLLRRHTGFQEDLARVRDVIALLVLGSACAVLSAWIGPASLALGGVFEWSLYWSVWLQWWMGDATGVIVFAPLLLAWWRPMGPGMRPPQAAEAVILAALTAALGEAVFGGLGVVREGYYPASLALFPLAVWVALRFGPRGATAFTLVVSLFAIWGTVQGRGPFVVEGGVDSLVRWWVFVNIITVTSLVLAAAKNEREQAQSALERERDFVATVLDTEAAIVLVLDRTGRIVRVNRALETLSGHRWNDLAGLPFIDTLIAPDHRPKAAAHDEILRLNLSSAARFEAELVRRNGERLQISWSNAALRDADGEIEHRIVTGIDITQRAQATAELRKARRELEARVRDRTRELATANAVLESEIAERRRLEREIIDAAEHEQMRIGQELHDGLGQQLTAVAFLTEVLAGQLAERSLPEAGSAVRIGKLMEEAVSQARLLARGLAPVDLDADGLMAALDQLAVNARSLFGIACEFRCAAPVLVHDKSVAIHLYRIAQEAVTNAVKHSGARGVTISLAAGCDGLTLKIADDGAGLPVDSLSSRAGMGLRTMRYRAKAVGAELAFETPEASGLIVTVALRDSFEETVLV
jgi:PAS domain S-box-containing protein